MIDQNITKDILNEFKPILVVYFPYYYIEDKTKAIRLEALKNKLGKAFLEKYFILFIPYQEDDFKLDLLSVVKTKYLKDTDLKDYILKLQDEILNNENKKIKNSDWINDFFK